MSKYEISEKFKDLLRSLDTDEKVEYINCQDAAWDVYDKILEPLVKEFAIATNKHNLTTERAQITTLTASMIIINFSMSKLLCEIIGNKSKEIKKQMIRHIYDACNDLIDDED